MAARSTKRNRLSRLCSPKDPPPTYQQAPPILIAEIEEYALRLRDNMALRQNARVRIGSLALRAEQVGSRVPFHEPDWKAAGTKLCRSLAQLPAGTLAHRGVQPTAISAQPAIDAVLRDDSIVISGVRLVNSASVDRYRNRVSQRVRRATI